jgi:hypothetical protein
VSLHARPEENTLGGIVGTGRRRGRDRPAPKAVVRATEQGATLGTAYLGIGGGVLCAIEAVYSLAKFFSNLHRYTDARPTIVAWVLFALAFAIVCVTLGRRGEKFPRPLFAAYLVVLAAVVALDFIGIAPLHDVGAFATASVTAGFGLLPMVTLRPPRDLLIAAAVLAAAFTVMTATTTDLDSASLPELVITIAIAVVPLVLAVYVLHRFRRMVQLELDRVLVQSTVTAPRFAVGMLASEELTRLDLAAEELLDSIAGGRTPLPLEPKTASKAASLATELRLHLIEGRRETWLYHAVTESEQLGKSTTLNDPGSLAGLLDPAQRDGLLSAMWLLVADGRRTPSTTTVALGPVLAPTTQSVRRTITIPIVIQTTGIPRARVDTAVWLAVQQVGEVTASMEDGSLRVAIHCVVTNPAGQ